MELLRVAGHRHDPARLLLAGPGDATFALAVDDALCEALEALAGDDGDGPAPSGPVSRLAPREIQTLLRAGNSPAQVARAAGTDEAWVRRWLPPIEAERARVVAALGRTTVRVHGRTASLAEAVEASLRQRGVAADSVVWSAQRSASTPAWTVTLRFREDGAMRRASWRYLPERQRAEPCSGLAAELAGGQRRSAGGRRPPRRRAAARAR